MTSDLRVLVVEDDPTALSRAVALELEAERTHRLIESLLRLPRGVEGPASPGYSFAVLRTGSSTGSGWRGLLGVGELFRAGGSSAGVSAQHPRQCLAGAVSSDRYDAVRERTTPLPASSVDASS